MASTTRVNRATNSAVSNGNQTQSISMTTISHHGNAFVSPSVPAAPKNASAPRPTARPLPSSSNLAPRPTPPKDDYVPLCDPHFRLPWIELGVGLLCALLSLCLMIAGLSRGSVVGEESVKTRNYSAVYVGVFFLLVAIGLNVTFAIHFLRVRRNLKDNQLENERLTDSRPLNQERQSYLADNLAFSGDEPSKPPPHSSYPSKQNWGVHPNYSVSRDQEPNSRATQEKRNLARQSVPQGPQSVELQAYGSSQLKPQVRDAKMRGAPSNQLGYPDQDRANLARQSVPQGPGLRTQDPRSAQFQAYGSSKAQVRGMTSPVQASYPIGSQTHGRAHGAYGREYSNQEKANLAQQSIPQGPQRAELQAYGSSQQAQIRGARMGETPSNHQGPQNLVQDGHTFRPQSQGRVGVYGAGNPNQLRGAVGFSASNVSHMAYSSGAIPKAQGAYGSTAAPQNIRTDRPPPAYVEGSEHSSSPPSYRTYVYNNEPQSLSNPVAQAPMLSDAQQRDIIERRHQRLGGTRGSSSVEMKVDVHHH